MTRPAQKILLCLPLINLLSSNVLWPTLQFFFNIFHVFKENTALKDKVYFEVHQKKPTPLTALL